MNVNLEEGLRWHMVCILARAYLHKLHFLLHRWQARKELGHMLADVPAVLGSLDIVFGEVDR